MNLYLFLDASKALCDVFAAVCHWLCATYVDPVRLKGNRQSYPVSYHSEGSRSEAAVCGSTGRVRLSYMLNVTSLTHPRVKAPFKLVQQMD